MRNVKVIAILYLLAVLAIPVAALTAFVAAGLGEAGVVGAQLAEAVVKAAVLCLATAIAVVAGVAVGALAGDARR